jgi:acyl-CoA synthetase (AMP-forming)/AMP-acid ligase II
MISETLPHRLAINADKRRNQAAFRFLGRRSGCKTEITWADLWREAAGFAAILEADGLPGRRIGLLCANPRDFVVVLAATMLAGSVAVPMPAVLNRRSAPRIHAILRAGGLAALVAPGGLLKADWLAGVDWQSVKPIALEHLQSVGTGGEPRYAADPAAPLLLQFTSGSTGAPSGILLSHANAAANCAAITNAYGLEADSIGLSWLPLHHDMGLVGHILMPIWVGGCSILMDPLLFLQQPLRWLHAVSEERATITSAPNFAYELCNRAAGGGEKLDFSLESLTTAVCGGEPVAAGTMEVFAETFAPCGLRRAALAPSYGLAEATLLVSAGKSPNGPTLLEVPAEEEGKPRRLVGVGRPVAGTRLRIVDSRTRVPLPEGEFGEIEVGGASVGRLLDAPKSEWVQSGDLGFVFNGELFVSGRSKELLILRGQNVFPADIEAAALAASAAIVPGGVAAIGIEQNGTEALVLVVEAHAGHPDVLASHLDRAIGEAVALATGHVPAAVTLVDAGSLPRTTSGKLRRGEIAELYRRGGLAGRNQRTYFRAGSLEHA